MNRDNIVDILLDAANLEVSAEEGADKIMTLIKQEREQYQALVNAGIYWRDKQTSFVLGDGSLQLLGAINLLAPQRVDAREAEQIADELDALADKSEIPCSYMHSDLHALSQRVRELK